jgi:hypothetical protein
MSQGARRVWGQFVTPVSDEVKRRFQRLLYWMWACILIMTILSFWPTDYEPWLWTKTVLMLVAVTVMGIKVTRFSLWQRDEYWRERGKDPKHPERLPEPPAD